MPCSWKRCCRPTPRVPWAKTVPASASPSRRGQAGTSRPSVKTPLPGLYIVGAEAGGAGVGTELAVNSAIEFFDTYVA